MKEKFTLKGDEIEDSPSKMERRLGRGKDAMWKRWFTKYVRALREIHEVTQKNQYYSELGEVMLVVSDSKNKHE